MRTTFKHIFLLRSVRCGFIVQNKRGGRQDSAAVGFGLFGIVGSPQDPNNYLKYFWFINQKYFR